MLDALKKEIKKYKKALVAYSGGVDSTVVLKAARETLGENIVALTALSASFPSYDINETKRVAHQIGARHIIVESNELDDPSYAANPTNRCYYCKSELFRLCRQKADGLQIETIFDGSNLDDLKDFRPGFQAKDEYKVVSPLVDAKLRKDDVRRIAKSLNLPNWDKSALPCLASRIPYGTEITTERLRQVDAVEKTLRKLGLKEFRARFHGEIVRIEVAPQDIKRVVDLKESIIECCRKNGFKFVTLDLEGFRSGRLNEATPHMYGLK